jgi:hypothetical protein
LTRRNLTSRAGACAAWIALAVAALAGQQTAVTGISVKLTNESAAPGGTAQVKLLVTEPQPISTGRGSVRYGGWDTIDGIALGAGAADAQGVAVVSNGTIEISFDSPSALLGTNTDYPILTIAGHVPSSAPMGATFPVSLDPGSLQIADPSGALEITEAAAGSVSTAPVLSIDDVRPGGALVPAKGIVSIFGTGFGPKTKVTLKNAKVADTRYVSPGQIDVTLAAPARMQGMMVKAVNQSGPSQTYFSYQRTTREGASQHPVLQHAVPLFSQAPAFAADVDLSCDDCGLAVQNPGTVAGQVTAELLLPDETSLGLVTFTVPALKYVVRSIPELFDLSTTPVSARVHVLATTPVLTMGIAVDAAGHASTLRAR